MVASLRCPGLSRSCHGETKSIGVDNGYRRPPRGPQCRSAVVTDEHSVRAALLHRHQGAQFRRALPSPAVWLQAHIELTRATACLASRKPTFSALAWINPALSARAYRRAGGRRPDQALPHADGADDLCGFFIATIGAMARPALKDGLQPRIWASNTGHADHSPSLTVPMAFRPERVAVATAEIERPKPRRNVIKLVDRNGPRAR